MGVLINLPKVIKIGLSMKKYNKQGKALDAAIESGDHEEERKIISACAGTWAKDTLKYLGVDLEIRGQENVPEENGLVFVCNHQGYADILSFLTLMDNRQVGFVAKEDLLKIPYVGTWIRRLRGVYLKRGNARDSLKALRDGSKLVQDGFNIVIFPEGTRSRGQKMGTFKPGAFKLATMAKAKIVPVSIMGSYHMYEETGKLLPCKITMCVHKPFETAGKGRPEIAQIEKEIEQIIRASTEELAEEEHQRLKK